MPLWAWENNPDLSDPAVRDYVRAALTAFVLSIPMRLPRPPVYRLETYHGQSPDRTHEEDHWGRWARAIHNMSQVPPSSEKAKPKEPNAKRPPRKPKK